MNDRSIRHTFQVFLVALRLGLISFGGPIAHIGYFREEYVNRRRWLDERSYLDVVALCQFLPGPASSQVGIIVGMMRAGLPGGLAAWLGSPCPRRWRSPYSPWGWRLGMLVMPAGCGV